MKIAVIGAGAMGSIYGGHLSLHHEVYLVDTNQTIVNHINANGLTLEENGVDVVYRPKAVTSTEGLETMDLIILFVKALFSEAALQGNKHIIGENTYLMTLQNGSGHEDILGKFAPENRVIIGTTEDNGAILGAGHVRHGGVGKTNIGMLVEDEQNVLPSFKDAFDICGFQTKIHSNIQQLIWDKLFTNVSLSVVTGVLQVPIGYISANPHAWNLTKQLLHEAVAVAHGLGLEADEAKSLESIQQVTINSPEGITSICADLRDGRKTEVDTISGSVVRASKKCGVPAPTHEMIVEMVHALEGK
ncbi:ketopantoate reductase family protein [Chakrabartyella piscis]|uniref:ketopantoate reductase family protein n=1 Tax=Chakrabartyella piscis TaxID=2918914 RepID=UPI0029585EE2|nr:ketopantoate reductase family protein [Chakrabartyella piscis]